MMMVLLKSQTTYEDGFSQLVPSEFLSESGMSAITALVSNISLDELHL